MMLDKLIPKKLYLGDGVYITSGKIRLTTENGLNVTNTIVLEDEVVQSLLEVLESWGHHA